MSAGLTWGAERVNVRWGSCRAEHWTELKKQTNNPRGKVCTAPPPVITAVWQKVSPEKCYLFFLLPRMTNWLNEPVSFQSSWKVDPLTTEEHVMVTVWHLPFYGFQTFVCWKTQDAETSDWNKKGSFSFDEPKNNDTARMRAWWEYAKCVLQSIWCWIWCVMRRLQRGFSHSTFISTNI